jgi:predicted ATP-binding protein involved in virulence
MYYIVLDIAYRSFVLNGTTDAKGVVVIDEIDLHLHPELEQVVLERFMNTFPNLQFIVSTHSPLVLTGVETKDEQNVILRMEPGTDRPETWHDIHGIDYNLMLEENMGVQKRKPIVQALFDKAWKSISDKQIAEAKSVVEELEKITPSDQSELIKLRAMIKRLEVIGR